MTAHTKVAKEMRPGFRLVGCCVEGLLTCLIIRVVWTS